MESVNDLIAIHTTLRTIASPAWRIRLACLLGKRRTMPTSGGVVTIARFRGRDYMVDFKATPEVAKEDNR